jgi:hypothetical protein
MCVGVTMYLALEHQGVLRDPTAAQAQAADSLGIVRIDCNNSSSANTHVRVCANMHVCICTHPITYVHVCGCMHTQSSNSAMHKFIRVIHRQTHKNVTK